MPIAVEHPAQETYAKKGPLDGVTRSREHKEKTRLNPTPMAHTQHNRENTEPNGRVTRLIL